MRRTLQRTWVAAALCLSLATSASAQSTDDLVIRASEELDAWRLEDAKAIIEEALLADPSHPGLLAVAAYLQFHRGHPRSAWQLLQAVGDDPVLRTMARGDLIEKHYAETWNFDELESAHFRVRFGGKDRAMALYALEVAEAAYVGLTKALAFGAAEGDEKIVIEIYPDAEGLANVTPLTVEEIETSGTIALCKYHRLMITSPRATVYGYHWAGTISHELVHLVVSKKTRDRVPVWLHEGIAKYMQSLWRGPAGLDFTPSSNKLLREAFAANNLVTFEEIHPSMAKLPSQDRTALAFAEVYLFVEHLLGRYGKDAVGKVLAWIAEADEARGVDTPAAFAAVTGVDFETLKAQWIAFMRGRDMRDEGIADAPEIALRRREAARESDDETIEGIEDKDAQDFARLGELLLLQDRPRAAVIEWEKAYTIVGPANPTLAMRLGRALLAQGDGDRALAVLSAAAEKNPMHGGLHVVLGRVHMERGDFDAAEIAYRVANYMNPFNPEVHAAFAKIARSRGDEVTAEREEEIFRIVQTAPNPRVDPPLPRVAPGKAGLNVAGVPFALVQIDGGPDRPAPVWGEPLEPGQHTVVFKDPRGRVLQQQQISLEADTTETLVVRTK